MLVILSSEIYLYTFIIVVISKYQFRYKISIFIDFECAN